MVYKESSLYSQATPQFQGVAWEQGYVRSKGGRFLVLNYHGHLAVLGRRIPACETPFGGHEVVASV